MNKSGIHFVVLASTAVVLSACSLSAPETQKNATASAAPPRVLGNAVWQIESIDGGGIIDSSMITMDLTEDGRIVGFTGCNRYFGDAAVSGDLLSLRGIGSTRRACAPALMNQEQRLLSALNESVRFAIDKDTWAVLYDTEGVERVRAIELESDPTANQPEPQDIGSGTPIVLDCEDSL